VTQNSSLNAFWKFLVLLLLIPVLASLVLNALAELLQSGGLLTLVALAIGAAICFQFRSTAVRLVVAFFILCWLSRVHQRPTFGSSLWVYVGIAVIVVAAYFIRQARIEHKSHPPKLHGVERKPVMPTTEEHE